MEPLEAPATLVLLVTMVFLVNLVCQAKRVQLVSPVKTVFQGPRARRLSAPLAYRAQRVN